MKGYVKKILLGTFIFILLLSSTAYAGYQDWDNTDKGVYRLYGALTIWEMVQAYDQSRETVTDITTTKTTTTEETEWSEDPEIIEEGYRYYDYMGNEITNPPASWDDYNYWIPFPISRTEYEIIENKSGVDTLVTTEYLIEKNTYEVNNFDIEGKIAMEAFVNLMFYTIADNANEKWRTPVLITGTLARAYMIYENGNKMQLSLYNKMF